MALRRRGSIPANSPAPLGFDLEVAGRETVILNPAAALTVQLTAADAGKMYVNVANQVITYLLPGPIPGVSFMFNDVRGKNNVVTATGALVFGKSDASANTTATLTGAAGATQEFTSDGVNWACINYTATTITWS